MKPHLALLLWMSLSLTPAAKAPGDRRFSDLSQITGQNVGGLQLQWTLSTGATRGDEAAPLVVGDTMYVVTASPSALHALDLGQPGAPEKWSYQPKPDAASGVAFAGGLVYFNTLDAHTVAVDSVTGKQVWSTQAGDLRLDETMTTAPAVARGKVYVGARRWLAALDARDGRVLWRAEGTGFLADPELDLVYSSTANPGPGDNTWTSGLVARNADSGEAVWSVQFGPHDLIDRGGVNEDVLADLTVGGEPRKALLHADRDGPLSVLDRATGEVLSARPATPGAQDWQPSAFSPKTGLLYLSRNTQEGGHRGELVAWDPVAGRPRWKLLEKAAVWSGALATAGDVIFYGTKDGWLNAVSAQNGAPLWQVKTASRDIGQPATYLGPDGKQYVAVLSGAPDGSGGVLSVFALP